MSKNISFKAHMALKARIGSKTQTRRVITAAWGRCLDLDDPDDCANAIEQAPYKVGDVAWLREPLVIHAVRFTVDKRADDEVAPVTLVRVRYPADGGLASATGWRGYPSRLAEPKAGRAVAYGCPREFARATVEITDVRVQRIQEISAADAVAEGIDASIPRPGSPPQYRNYLNGEGYFTSSVESFRTLWDSINAARGFGWEENPHVFAYTFRLLTQA